MVRFKSQSEISSHEARNFFIPSGAETILYFLLSIILILVLNSGDIIHRLSNNYIGSPQNLKANFTTLSDGFSHSFSTALGGRLGQMLLWSFVGALAYIGLWLAKNILNSFENDIISDHYMHPSAYSRAGYWGSSFSVKIFLAAQVLIIAGFTFTVITAVLPSISALAGSAAYGFDWTSSPLYILFSILGTALVMYIAVVLFRLLSHLWKLL
jgi:hypothetical protein